MTVSKKMLLVDDDKALRQALVEYFQLHEAFVIDEVSTAADALQHIKCGLFDIILLNVGLPDMDGRAVCRLMRRNKVTSPIIMLSGAATPADIILGLNAGANDYVTKPFRPRVLAARVRAQIRAYTRIGDVIFTIGPYEFRPATKVLVNRTTNARKSLTVKETALLNFLYNAGNNAVGRDVLLAEIWDYSPEVITHTLESLIYRLRQKIESNPSNPKMLMTEAGGYRLVR